MIRPLQPIRSEMRFLSAALAVLLWSVGASFFDVALAQLDPRRGPPGCVPVAERRAEIGCYVVASIPLSEFEGPVFWHLDRFGSRAEADAIKGPTGTVVEALERVWLFTIEAQDWKAIAGAHVGKVGPLVIKPGVKHTASYLEAIMLPGAETSVHHHPGPEALFVFSGEECMETPEGMSVGRPEGPNIIVSGYVPHRLTITGAEKRRSLGLILHESSQPIAIREHEHGWHAKDLCRPN